MGGEDSWEGRRPLFPVGRCRWAGEAAGDLVAGGTQKERRTGAAIGGHWTAFPSEARAPSSAPRESPARLVFLYGERCWRTVCIILCSSWAGAWHCTRSVASPVCSRPHLSSASPPPRLPEVGFLALCSPRSPGLLAPLPFLPPAGVHSFPSQAPSRTRSVSPFYLGLDFPLELWVGKLLTLFFFNAISVLYTSYACFFMMLCVVIILLFLALVFTER